MAQPRGLFIAGTGTGVGKTYIAAAIARALSSAGKQVGVYKPVASGCDAGPAGVTSGDAVALWEAAGRPGELERVAPQRFLAPLAPHLAARAEGKQVSPKLLREGLDYWLDRSEVVIVEGAGGLMSPVSDDDYCADLAYEIGFPLIVVAANELGAINATMQTLITAATFREGLSVAGIVLNQVRPAEDDLSIRSNAQELEMRAVPPLLASVQYQVAANLEKVDWYKLATRRKPGLQAGID